MILKLLVIAAFLTGCAQMFTAKTVASYVTPDGRMIHYESDKEQIGLEAVYTDKDGKTVSIKVDRAGTQESVIAATLQMQMQLLQMIQQLTPLLKGAGGGL